MKYDNDRDMQIPWTVICSHNDLNELSALIIFPLAKEGEVRIYTFLEVVLRKFQ
jgi:hypothetical protein